MAVEIPINSVFNPFTYQGTPATSLKMVPRANNSNPATHKLDQSGSLTHKTPASFNQRGNIINEDIIRGEKPFTKATTIGTSFAACACED